MAQETGVFGEKKGREGGHRRKGRQEGKKPGSNQWKAVQGKEPTKGVVQGKRPQGHGLIAICDNRPTRKVRYRDARASTPGSRWVLGKSNNKLHGNPSF